jgi:predicted dehydrogenase
MIEAGYTFASMAPGGDFEWRIATARATLIDRGDTATVTTLDDATTRALPPLPAGTRYRAFMADTLQRLHEGRPPLVGFADYLAAMTLVDRITEAAR